MTLPPCIVSVRVVEAERTRVRIWVPVLLLLPLLLLLGLLGMIAALVVDAALMAGDRGHGYAALLLGSFDALCATRGVEVRVNDKNRTVVVTVR